MARQGCSALQRAERSATPDNGLRTAMTVLLF
jgi:hypothetical protein